MKNFTDISLKLIEIENLIKKLFCDKIDNIYYYISLIIIVIIINIFKILYDHKKCCKN